MTSSDEWQRAIDEAEAGDCAALLRLAPDWRIGTEINGSASPLDTALAERPLLKWRIAVAVARRGDPELLAVLVAYRGPVPEATAGPPPVEREIDESVWTSRRVVLRKEDLRESLQQDVFRILAHPRPASKVGRARISDAARATIMREAAKLLADGATKPSPTIVKQIAGEHDVSEKSVRAYFGRYVGKKIAD